MADERKGSALAPVAADQARSILEERDWDGRFTGVEMSPATGNCDVQLYSLAEAGRFLRSGTAGMGFARGGGGSISWLDFDRFAAWLEGVLEDPELARAIRTATAGETVYREQVRAASHLVDLRLEQLEALVGDGADEDGGTEASEEAGSGADTG